MLERIWESFKNLVDVIRLGLIASSVVGEQ